MIASGQSIGNYRILSKIGTGGMGAVYLAEHPLIGKRVALKVIHRELAGNKEVVQRFFQESRAVNKIGNEHIVEIHDFGITPENDHFYIMEYLEGQTLASVLSREGVLDVMRALHVGAQIASALAAAHASGVIHRDLKPDNIMLMSRLGDRDFVKVLDFGLAKMFSGGNGAVKTAYGVLLGTPQYMSPEACESKPNLDHRTDIYALGVLLFQMLTGGLPFTGESMGEVLVKQVTQLPPAPRGINPQIPPSVEQIVLRCLSKPADGRFPTMIALREALVDPEAYLRGSPPMAPARSVAPGAAPVDARTVMAHVAALGAAKTQAVNTGGANEQRTRIGMGAPLPPNASFPGHAAASQAQTMAAGAQHAPVQQQNIPRTGVLQIPGLAQPAVPSNNTMRIATPMGYSSRPPRKVWPIVLVLSLVIGLGAGIFAVVYFGGDEDKPAAAASGSETDKGSDKQQEKPTKGSAKPATNDDAKPPPDKGSAKPVANNGSGSGSAKPDAGSAKPDAGSGSSGSGSAAVAKATLLIESTPEGATVKAPDGTVVGKTPVRFEWPIGDKKVVFEVRLAGYKKKTTELVVKSNTTVGVELEAMPYVAPTPPTGRGSGKTGGPTPGPGSSKAGTGLERPGD